MISDLRFTILDLRLEKVDTYTGKQLYKLIESVYLFLCVRHYLNIVLTSVTTPVIAAAAAVNGEARNVRPPFP